MYHPLYYHARRYAGQPVFVYHQNGVVYHGIVSMVTPTGVYLLNCHPIQRLIGYQANESEAGLELVYAPGAYFAFGALTGLTIGALAYGLYW